MNFKTFRIDDISTNTNLYKLEKIIDRIIEFYGDNQPIRVILGVSCMTHNMDDCNVPEKERLFPKILNAHSDFRVFYNVDHIGIPDLNHILFHPKYITQKNLTIEVASHGLMHIDHRLLSYDLQEFNILCSVSLIRHKFPDHFVKKFIMPFNKFDEHTKTICKEHNIEILAWDYSWQHMSYITPENKDEAKNIDQYYMHTHDFSTIDDFSKKLDLLK